MLLVTPVLVLELVHVRSTVFRTDYPSLCGMLPSLVARPPRRPQDHSSLHCSVLTFPLHSVIVPHKTVSCILTFREIQPPAFFFSFGISSTYFLPFRLQLLVYLHIDNTLFHHEVDC